MFAKVVRLANETTQSPFNAFKTINVRKCVSMHYKAVRPCLTTPVICVLRAQTITEK